MLTLWQVSYIIIAYLIGSIPSGIIYSQLVHKVDVRKLGSGNSGGTNVGRNFGFRAAVIVSVADAVKGFLPTILAIHVFFPGQHLIIMLVAIACVLGHSYPIWAEFKGGKIMATSAGVMVAFDFYLFLVMLAIFGLVLFVTSTVSVASLTSFTFTTLYIAVTNPHWVYKIGFIFMGIFMFYRHRENVSRLLSGTERRINWGLRNPKHD